MPKIEFGVYTSFMIHEKTFFEINKIGKVCINLKSTAWQVL